MISELARVAKISLWDIEGTLLAVKVQQAAASLDSIAVLGIVWFLWGGGSAEILRGWC
jgi:hypothetical protein